MIDTYLKSRNKAALEGLRPFLRNVMDVQQGRAAKPEGVDEEGNIIPAQEAVGDPDYFYTCVRAVFPVPAFADVEVCAAEEGAAAVGVWG
ncbi:MAG TPA: hypothetical protein DCY07_01730 [Rhodospirillaceae bacterium]|nr:hypothetical protein [Rhodospirillaceae bacterium]